MAGDTGAAILFLLITLLILPIPTTADPFWLFTVCPDDKPKYTLNSQFEKNLKELLQVLPGKTSSSSGFNDTHVGDIPDEVYGQALCRGDVNSTVCQNCVDEASQEILKNCTSKDAIIWYQYCQVRYSYNNFSGESVYTGKFPGRDNDEKNASNPVDFNKHVALLLTSLSKEAAFNLSKRMFATGETKFPENKKIYGLVQCTRDISEDECDACFRSALGELDACCDSKQGGIIVSRNCNLRFEIYSFYDAAANLLPHQTSSGFKWKTWMIVFIVCSSTIVFAIITWCFIACLQRTRGDERDEQKSRHVLLQELATPRGVTMIQQGNLMSSEELHFMDLNTIAAATNNFSSMCKLGQGGFGTVYKGTLLDGKEIAVKRLSKRSWQGLNELRNEVILIAKLRHRNLARLLGCAIEGEEKLLIYEFMPNKSLDTFIFNSDKRAELDWTKCYNIVIGIARGLLYLHEDSRLKIIHRDLKPNNVLLDGEMVPKISDFGMARIFGENQNIANTKRVVGTYGYMAPEYAMEGLFSVKSDVFSFGVILLEIISGKKNSGFYLTGHAQTLLAYAWRLWNEGKEQEFIDPNLMATSKTEEVVRCIHIGLLCVQEDPADRPPMSSVVPLLESEPLALPHPKQPALVVGRLVPINQSSSKNPSAHHITIF